MSIEQVKQIAKTVESIDPKSIAFNDASVSLGNFSFAELEQNISLVLDKLGFSKDGDKQVCNYLVTAETLKTDDSLLKEAKKIYKAVDRFRIDGKKILSIPAKDFESKCKASTDDLLFSIEYINNQVKAFEDKVRAQIKELCIAEIEKNFNHFQIEQQFKLEFPESLNKKMLLIGSITTTGKLTKSMLTEIDSYIKSCQLQQQTWYSRIELAQAKAPDLELEDYKHFLLDENFNEQLDALIQRNEQRKAAEIARQKEKLEREAREKAEREAREKLLKEQQEKAKALKALEDAELEKINAVFNNADKENKVSMQLVINSLRAWILPKDLQDNNLLKAQITNHISVLTHKINVINEALKPTPTPTPTPTPAPEYPQDSPEFIDSEPKAITRRLSITIDFEFKRTASEQQIQDYLFAKFESDLNNIAAKANMIRQQRQAKGFSVTDVKVEVLK